VCVPPHWTFKTSGFCPHSLFTTNEQLSSVYSREGDLCNRQHWFSVSWELRFYRVVIGSRSQHHRECKRRGRNCPTEKLNERCVGRAHVKNKAVSTRGEICQRVVQCVQKVSMHLMITIQKVTSNVQSAPASLQTFIYTRLTLTPSVIPNSNYVSMVSDWNCLKYFCLFFVL
jgi:hypothetical protein